jgi:hypothetical protein
LAYANFLKEMEVCGPIKIWTMFFLTGKEREVFLREVIHNKMEGIHGFIFPGYMGR